MFGLLQAIRLAILLGAAAMVPATPLVRDRVDAIELNHVYDSDGRLVLRQFIFWDWHDGDGQFRVVAWRLFNEGQPLPWRDLSRGGYVLLWRDGQVLRWIEADAFHETWTQYDREIEDRQQLSQDRRRGLTRDAPPSTAAAAAPPRR